MRKTSVSFRVGKVQGYLRGNVWYLCYHENGQLTGVRVSVDQEVGHFIGR